MRAIFIKALVVANVSFFAIAALVAFIVVFGAVLGAWLLDGAAQNPHDVAAGLKASALFFCFVFASAMIVAAIGAGYLAGRIARRRHVINGALASGVWTLMNVYELVHGPIFGDTTGAGVQIPKLLEVALLYGTPLFGAVGGFLARERDARLAAAGPAPAGAIRGASNVLRWLLAIAVAAAAYLVVLKLVGALEQAIGGGGVAFVLAVAIAIVLGTAVVPAHQRKAAGFMFIALAILIPAEEWMRNALSGGLEHRHSYDLLFNTLGAALAYVYCRSAFPAQFPSRPGAWWWLTSFDYAQWSPPERRARIALLLTALAVWIALFLLVDTMLAWAGVDAHVAAPAAALLSMVPAFVAARPIATPLFREVVRQADANAAVRLGARASGAAVRS
jgi:hypothetical protein